jgi:CRISPR-associated protein Cas5d
VVGREPPLAVKVWGELACFTRPEMKVERVSYPVMTPSAARGVLESIFWKPEFAWQVRAIAVLADVQYFSTLRNEVNSLASDRAARGWERGGGLGGYFAAEDRTQRHTLALRDVAYVIEAEMVLRPDVRDDPAKYRDQFRRRVRRGQCLSRPYLGCREFAADFAEPDGSEQPIEWSGPLGRMLLDIEYEPGGSGRGTPRFFDAEIESGVLRVPARAFGWQEAA